MIVVRSRLAACSSSPAGALTILCADTFRAISTLVLLVDIDAGETFAAELADMCRSARVCIGKEI